MSIADLFQPERSHRRALASGHVVPESTRCVQCGICTYNCPIGIDVRRHVWLDQAVEDSHCLTCGECILRCPRGVLRFDKTDLLSGGKP